MPYPFSLAVMLFGALLCLSGAGTATLFVGLHAVSFWTFMGLACLTAGSLCLAGAFIIVAFLVWKENQ